MLSAVRRGEARRTGPLSALVAAGALSEQEHGAPEAMLAGALLPGSAELAIGLDVRVIEGSVIRLVADIAVGNRPGFITELVEECLAAQVWTNWPLCCSRDGPERKPAAALGDLSMGGQWEEPCGAAVRAHELIDAVVRFLVLPHRLAHDAAPGWGETIG